MVMDREAPPRAEPGPRGQASVASTRRGRGTALGVAYVVASAVCFGTLPIFARLAFASGVDTSTLLLLRFSIAAAIMWVVLAARGAALPRGRGLAMLAGMGAIGYAGQAFSYFTAVSLASAGLAALLLYLYPALVAILSRVVFRHPLSGAQVLAIGMALLGSLLTIGRAGDGTPLGVFFGVLAALIYSVYILTGGRLPAGITATASTTVVSSSAAVIFAGVVLLRGAHLPRTPVGWAAVLAIAIVCTVLAVAFFLAGLERLGPVRASVFSTIEPATTLVLAAALLGEQLTILRVAGGALILGAVLLLARHETT
jgi:drug/metabolite transporter (DMT)-like permease